MFDSKISGTSVACVLFIVISVTLKSIGIDWLRYLSVETMLREISLSSFTSLLNAFAIRFLEVTISFIS